MCLSGVNEVLLKTSIDIKEQLEILKFIFLFFSGKVNLYCCWSGYNHLIRHHLNEGESDGREQTEWELWTARGDC